MVLHGTARPGVFSSPGGLFLILDFDDYGIAIAIDLTNVAPRSDHLFGQLFGPLLCAFRFLFQPHDAFQLIDDAIEVVFDLFEFIIAGKLFVLLLTNGDPV